MTAYRGFKRVDRRNPPPNRPSSPIHNLSDKPKKKRKREEKIGQTTQQMTQYNQNYHILFLYYGNRVKKGKGNVCNLRVMQNRFIIYYG